MKIWLSVLLIATTLIHFAMQERETLGERISQNLFAMRAQNIERIAFADSRRLDAEISPSAVVNHISHLRSTIADDCQAGQRLLAAAATTYKPNVVDLNVNNQLTQQIRKMCQ
jgi:hypothetical protein